MLSKSHSMMDVAAEKETTSSSSSSDSSSCSCIIDKSPVNLSYDDIQSRSDLLIAMIYNLALAYHLHALTLKKEKKDCYTTLENAFKLYREVERRLRIRSSIFQDAVFPISPSLENNIHHVLKTGFQLVQIGCPVGADKLAVVEPELLLCGSHSSTKPAVFKTSF